MNRKLPEINIEDLKKAKEENFRERLEFLDSYARWVKSTNNAKWSSAQKAFDKQKDGLKISNTPNGDRHGSIN